MKEFDVGQYLIVGRYICINFDKQNEIINKYKIGQSKYSLSKQYHVDTSTIKKVLDLNSIKQRDDRYNVY